MKPGLRPGASAETRVLVQPDMTPGFVPYPVYSTYRLARDCEWTARLVILPYLEPGEAGVGAGLRLRHGRPAAVGSTVVVQATCIRVRGPLVVCRVEATAGGARCGWGVVHQMLLPEAELRRVLQPD